MATKRMQIGLLLRQGELHRPGEDGRLVGWSELRQMATLADDVGFDTIWVGDHLLLRDAPDDDQPVHLPAGVSGRGMWDAPSLIAAMAMVTKRVTLGPAAACTSFRNPALLAKIADTLDEISGGRLILMLGAGWHSPEYAAFGYPFDHRVGRFEEALQIIVPLLREGHVDFEGRYYMARDCELRPRGPRSGGPPIWIGGKRPRMLRLVARYADAHNYGAHGGAHAVAELSADLDAACGDVGRDPSTLRRTCNVQIVAPGMHEPLAPVQVLRGSTDDIARQLHAYASAGIKHLTLYAFPWELKTVEHLGPVIEALRKLEATA